jgi:fumarylacetoacetase
MSLDETHDPQLRSWEPTANRPGHDFPIQNLPYGVFRTEGDAQPRVGAAIGDFIFDLREIIDATSLNPLMALPKSQRIDLRRRISRILSDPSQKRELIPMSAARMLLPAEIGDYTDFFASIHHATRTGKLFRPDHPLSPNYEHVPVAYHGRASSIVVSGVAVRRPHGQLGQGKFGPSQRLDYELELGAFIGPGNPMGEPIPIARAAEHLFGVCLLNDWSARDIQMWESQPLGPFLGKSFATSISPWVVTMEALEPFRCAAPDRPAPLEYLRGGRATAYDITLEAWLNGRRTCRSNFRDMFWTLEQMVAHHTSNGCPLRAGDLIGSGTVSGPSGEAHGCLLESNGPWLQDGDSVELRGWAEREGAVRIGLGVCEGRIALPSK